MTLLILGSPIPASARTITADVDNRTCVVADARTSPVVEFWDDLEGDVRNRRLDELDAQDPGIRADIESYIATGSPGPSQLQERLDSLGSGEGLAMLVPEVTDPDAAAQYKTEYSYDEARSTVDAITDDPAAGVLEQLRQAGGTRIAEIRTDTFAQRSEEFNAIQLGLRDDFQECIDEIDRARPIPVQYLILGGAGILAVAALVIRAWSNSRRSNRHSGRDHRESPTANPGD
ncbi:hypothetical protein [Corynebacterium pacaense]|uniref:hypothetical protein n=1 Tax=Corynebacterium pacaense TaxID=1816684 RepID=UPI001FEC79D1|nr:hypothetical protein [Corynebacterium pacaense]